MKKVVAVLLLALSQLTVVSPFYEDEETVKLCGDDFYEECKRLTEESSRMRRDLSSWEQDSVDSAKEVRRLAKRNHEDDFMPIPLGLMKQTCCLLGCTVRFMRHTCQ